MKYEITRRGVYGADGNQIPVGGVVEHAGDKMPGYLIGKAAPVKTGKVAVINPAGLKIEDLKALAESEGIDLGDASKKDDIIAAIELAREAEPSA